MLNAVCIKLIHLKLCLISFLKFQSKKSPRHCRCTQRKTIENYLIFLFKCTKYISWIILFIFVILLKVTILKKCLTCIIVVSNLYLLKIIVNIYLY